MEDMDNTTNGEDGLEPDEPVSDDSVPSEPASSRWFLWTMLGWAALGAIVMVLLWFRPFGPKPTEALGSSIPLPSLVVAGWLSPEKSVSADDLQGKVVLIDCWASWCGPCRANMPELVEFYRKFQDQGLLLIGLTPEEGEELVNVELYVPSVEGLDWPIGFGAEPTIQAMGVEAYPTLILFNKSGQSVWSGHVLGGLEKAVIAALK